MAGLSTVHIKPPGKRVGPIRDYFYENRALETGFDRLYTTLEEGGVDKELAGYYEFEPEGAYAELRLGGSLVTVKPDRPAGSGSGGDIGRRGDVTGFSSASRRRLMRAIASIERRQRPIFVTMTYPDLFTGDHATWKRDIAVFGKRLSRAFPKSAFVWRIEFKARRSGASEGMLAPHFHLLVYGSPYLRLRSFVSDAWYEVVGSGSADHLAAGTRVERIWSFRGIMRYVGKYIAKVDTFPPLWTGRAWGIVGRERMPWARVFKLPLSNAVAQRLVRVARKMMGMAGKTLIWGVTWIVNADRIMDYLNLVAAGML